MPQRRRVPMLARNTLWYLILFGALALIGMIAAVVIPRLLK
jgi:acyl-CoA synthetase (AMP-forming)/AMP-acid ligase II